MFFAMLFILLFTDNGPLDGSKSFGPKPLDRQTFGRHTPIIKRDISVRCLLAIWFCQQKSSCKSAFKVPVGQVFLYQMTCNPSQEWTNTEIMNTLQLIRQNLGRVFNCRRYCTHDLRLPCNTVLLRVENSYKITVRFSAERYCARHPCDQIIGKIPHFWKK